MIADELLNVAARVLLRTCAPITAHSVLRRVGRLLPQRRTRQELVAAAAALSPRGTCLSRALALAATAPVADVVIGVSPKAPFHAFAHAWIEVEGRPLAPDDPSGREIARLRGSPRRAVA